MSAGGPRSRPRASGIPERRALALLILSAWLLYVACFNTYQVPNNDFFRFRENALAYLNLTLPESVKRLPVFSLLIGVMSLIMPGPHPILLAAQVLNVLLAPVVLWFIHRTAREFTGPKTSLVVTALSASHWMMFHAAAQPLLELTLLSLVLATVVLALRGTRWAYVTAAAASLTRYEAAALIPALVLQDWLRTTGPRRLRSLLWGAASAAGLGLWMAHSVLRSAAVNPYVEEIIRDRGNLLAFVGGSLRLATDFLPGAVVEGARWHRVVLAGALVLAGAGWLLLLRRHRARLTVLLGFLGAYTVIHTLFPTYVSRYTFPILWGIYLGAGAAVAAFLSRLRKLPAGPTLRRAGAAAVWVVVCLILGAQTSFSVQAMHNEHFKTNRAQFRLVGEWYREVATDEDRMLTAHWRVVSYYSGLPEPQFLAMEDLRLSTVEALLQALREGGVTYVVWDNAIRDLKHAPSRREAALVARLRDLIELAPNDLEPVRRFSLGRQEAIVYRFVEP